MITNFKIYEKMYYIYDVNIGDYVITMAPPRFEDSKNKEIMNFTSSHVGLVVDKYKNFLLLKYDEIPNKLKNYSKNNIFKINCFFVDELSKDKSKLETILNTKKYNL